MSAELRNIIVEALESVPPDQREQALQSALSRYFGGAELSGLEMDAKREVGAKQPPT